VAQLKSLLRLAFGSLILGGVVGLVLFGLVVAFEDAFAVMQGPQSIRGRGGPATLLLLTAFIGGRVGFWLMRRVSDMSGMGIVAPLAFIAGGAALGTGYLLAIGHVSLPHSMVFGLIGMSAACLVITACVMEWLDR